MMPVRTSTPPIDPALFAPLVRALAEMGGAFFVTDPAGRCLLISRAASALLAGTAEDACAPAPDAPDGRPAEQSVFRALHARVVAGETAPDETLGLPHPGGGEALQVLATATRLADPGGGLAGVVFSLRDVTGMRDLQREHEQILHSVSHDLRTPLTSIMVMSQLLQRSLGPAGLPALSRAADLITSAALRLESMISDLVDAARFETGQLRLELRPVSVPSRVRSLLSSNPQALEVGRVLAELPADLPPALADESRLDRVLVHLVAHALKVSPPGSPVRLAVTASPADLTISVSHTGAGLPPEVQVLLLERSQRPRDASHPEVPGLYITRRLVEAQGGSIRVAGGGSTLLFTLPLAPPEAGQG